MRAWFRRTPHDHPNWVEWTLSLAVLLGLALPLMPLPGDTPAHLEARYRVAGMKAAHAFAATTSWTACTVLAAALVYNDPATGTFTRITCR
jgi:hypothetical protein